MIRKTVRGEEGTDKIRLRRRSFVLHSSGDNRRSWEASVKSESSPPSGDGDCEVDVVQRRRREEECVTRFWGVIRRKRNIDWFEAECARIMFFAG